MSDVTRILSQIEAGDPLAAADLLPLVYAELRKLAAARLAREEPGQTLQATSLVHEAYVRLVKGRPEQNWNSRGHFFGAAAEAMRRILVENARRKRSAKRGRPTELVELSEIFGQTSDKQFDLLDLDEAMTLLEQEHPDTALVVKLRFFAGLTWQETAAAAGVSLATAQRRWALGRAWLFGRLGGN